MKKILKLKYHLLVLSAKITTYILIPLFIYNFLLTSPVTSTFYLKDSSAQTLLNTLEDNGYRTYGPDALILKFVTLPVKGWYHMPSNNMGRFNFFRTLYLRQAKTMHIKIFAGETSVELTKRLANDMKLDDKKLLKFYEEKSVFKEADIISGRYIVARDANESTIIDYLFDASRDKIHAFEKLYCQKKFDQSELKNLLIISSIIQKESNLKREMALISSVIYNRLEKNMRLQMDGTLNYGEYAHTIVTPERLKTDESGYNTYKHKGLPPAPLGTISIEALEAAYRPEATTYLYFMLSNDGSHSFASNYEDHIKNIRAFKTKSKENNITKTKENNTTKINNPDTTKQIKLSL